MNPNLRCTDEGAIVGVIDPQSATTAKSTGWINAALAANFVATIMAGAFASSATLNAKIEQATDSSGTGVKDVTGKAITQLTEAGEDDNKQAQINVRPDDLDIENDFSHFRLTVTPATAAVLISADVRMKDAVYSPASDSDLASVKQIV